jgi:hypothetical protein
VESRGRSFTDLWPVADDYIIAGGVVRPLLGGKVVPLGTLLARAPLAQEYLPMARRELPAELAKAASGMETEVLGFVRRYGLLGYVQAWRFPLEALGAARSRIYTPDVPGDPFVWFTAHAQAVKLVGDLGRALGDTHDLARIIEELTIRGAHGADEITFTAPTRGYTRPRQVRLIPGRDPRTIALRIIEAIVNPNLEGVSRILLTEQRRPITVFAPQNLLDCVYWLLADAIVSATVRTCLACDRFFVATHDRMRFCPRPMGLKGVSLCMNRFKQQRFRDAKERQRRQPNQSSGRIRHHRRRRKS